MKDFSTRTIPTKIKNKEPRTDHPLVFVTRSIKPLQK